MNIFWRHWPLLESTCIIGTAASSSDRVSLNGTKQAFETKGKLTKWTSTTNVEEFVKKTFPEVNFIIEKLENKGFNASCKLGLSMSTKKKSWISAYGQEMLQSSVFFLADSETPKYLAPIVQYKTTVNSVNDSVLVTINVQCFRIKLNVLNIFVEETLLS